MIENKKLFFTTLIVTFLLCLLIDVPMLLLQLVPIGSVAMGLFFVGNGALGIVAYTLIYKALKKTEIVKKIYKLILAIGILVLISGVVVTVVSL